MENPNDGKRPDGMTLDRIDTTGDYEPHKSRGGTLADLGAAHNISPQTLASRLRRGWTLADATGKPVRAQYGS